ncbi:MAG: DUF4956 domain-containing protein [Gemmatimonadota bacterium]
MQVFTKAIDFFTMGSVRPMRRLLAYYIVVVAITAALVYFFPVFDRLFSGERLEDITSAPQLLQDGLGSDQFQTPVFTMAPRLELAFTTFGIMIGTLALMLPVSWVYMSSRRASGYNQSVVQTLIILPIVVAGIVLMVRNSLALAFSLAGIVAGVRFRTSLKDARDAVFVFLAIGVGLAAGVQALTVALLFSLVFNFVVLLIWRYDFGRNVLEPTAGGQWSEQLNDLAATGGNGSVPDRDLMLALTPKKVKALEERFARVHQILGTNGKKPRYNAVLWVTTDKISEAQGSVEKTLDLTTKRWKLDEVVSNQGKPSELYFLVRLGKSMTREELITTIRDNAGPAVQSAEVEMGESLAPHENDS